MRTYIKIVYLLQISVSIFCTSGLFAQSTQQIEAAARAHLTQRGINESELRAKLAQKGVDLDAIRPDQLPAMQPVIEQAIAEIEAERRVKPNSPSNNSQPGPFDISERLTSIDSNQSPVSSDVKEVAAKATTEVKERLQEGATVQEAVIESLTEGLADRQSTNIFGQEIFKNKTLDLYRTTKDARPTENYILGVGDELSVVIFGASQGDFRFIINEEGYIDPPGVGKILLKGVPYGKARELVYNRFSRAFVFRRDQFIFNLATARIITVNIFGEVINSGSFTISAINTAFNALAAAGGPSTIGSVRNIKVVRNGKPKDLDVYEFMDNPTINNDYFLENNDIIHVPVAEKVVTIKGAIHRPAVYELKKNENLSHLVKFAGGPKPTAYTKRLQIRRFISDKTILLEIDFNTNPNYELLNGDEITVNAIPTNVENIVTVGGEVDFPGTYALEKNLDLAALAFKANPKRTARTDLAFLMRTLTDGNVKIIQVDLDQIMQGKNQPFLLEPADHLMVFKQERYTDAFTVSLNGAVREPSSQPYNKGFKLSEYILLSGGLRDDATDFGYILRTNAYDGTKTYMRINPLKAVQDPNGPENILLQGQDFVRIYSIKEFKDNDYVRVAGAVRAPIRVPYGSALTLSEAIKMAGGMRIGAAKGRIDLYRLELNDSRKSITLAQSLTVEDDLGNLGSDILLQPYDEIIVREIPDFSLIQKVRVDGEVKYPGEYALITENERISDIITRAGGLTNEAFAEGGTLLRTSNPSGYIVTRFDRALKRRQKRYDLVLEPGDLINIPKRLDLVIIMTANTDASEVISSTYLSGSDKVNVVYQPGKRGRWYVREYVGGRGDYTTYRKMKVFHANGRTKKSADFGLFAVTPKVYPGSKIMLPFIPDKAPKPKKKKDEEPPAPKKERDYDKLFTQILSFASVTATMILAYAALKK